MARRNRKVPAYRYVECGLDNVFIEGIALVVDDAGETVYSIPHITGLHRAIAKSIVSHEHGISPPELRFLRTEMGMTQAELATTLYLDRQAIGRWERGECPIDPRAEALIRAMAVNRLHLDVGLTVEELAARCVPTAEVQMISIDGSDPSDYRPLRRAA